MRKAVLSVTLAILIYQGGQVPVAIPEEHPVASVIEQLLCTHLVNMLPADLHSIKTDMPYSKMWPKELPENLR